MEGAKRRVVVVCGYGCHLNTPLKPYLNRVANFIGTKNPDLVIFCGGPTQQKSAPGVAEATLMRGFVLSQLPYRFQGSVRLEVNSRTTLYNIRGAAAEIRNWIFHHARGEKVRITIFCEAQRAPNVDMLARHFMKDLVDKDDHIDIETSSWERANPFKQAGNLIYNRLAMSFPYLAEREQRKRIRRAKHI